MKDNIIEELFDKSKTYRMGILCTYSLNIEFLENYLLNLDGLANYNNLCIFTDRSIYNKQFENNSITRSKWVNKRYLLTPVDTNGVFHPKLYIMASEKSVRIAIGSANLTREGLASNLEIASVFEVTRKDRTYMGLLIECLQFIKELAEHSKSISAIRSINEFLNYVSEFTKGQMEENIHLLHNMEQSISKQVVDLLEFHKVNKIQVISPFYDNSLKVHKWLKKIFFDADVSIYVQQGKSNFPITEYAKQSKDTKIYVYKNQERYIHGKVIIFITDNGSYILTGSANFTASAMLSEKYQGNVETSLWGMVDNEIVDQLTRPNRYKPFLLKNIDELGVDPIHMENDSYDEIVISDWLIEALLLEDHIQLVTRNKEGHIPQKLIVNDDRSKTFNYSEMIDIAVFNRSEIMFVHIEGIDMFGDIVKSGKVRIVNLDKEKEGYNKKRYSVSEPSQLSDILKEFLQNGTEEELIDYLYKFNIPLELVGLNLRNSGLRAKESQGNLFGELLVQKGCIISYTGMEEAITHFLTTNYNKLCKHYENIQLLKINNFILIFSAMFSMMNTVHDNIIASHRKNPIEAMEWTKMRYYYDLFLEYSKDCLELLWLTNNDGYSYADLVSKAIKKDKQKMMGNVKNFKEFIARMGYADYLLDCYKTVKNICKWVNIYIEQGKVLTTVGTIRPMPISSNGMSDLYIIRRKEIYQYANMLEKDLEDDL